MLSDLPVSHSQNMLSGTPPQIKPQVIPLLPSHSTEMSSGQWHTLAISNSVSSLLMLPHLKCSLLPSRISMLHFSQYTPKTLPHLESPPLLLAPFLSCDPWPSNCSLMIFHGLCVSLATNLPFRLARRPTLIIITNN